MSSLSFPVGLLSLFLVTYFQLLISDHLFHWCIFELVLLFLHVKHILCFFFLHLESICFVGVLFVVLFFLMLRLVFLLLNLLVFLLFHQHIEFFLLLSLGFLFSCLFYALSNLHDIFCFLFGLFYLFPSLELEVK